MIFGKLFGKNEDKDVQPRVLNHPKDLQKGDVISFKLFAPGFLKGESFTVDEVNTYDYGDGPETEFVLRGPGSHTVFMHLDETEDDPTINLSLKINRETVETLFDLDQFALILDQADGTVEIPRQADPAEIDKLTYLSEWTAPVYVREAYQERGYFHKGDFRGRSVPTSKDGAAEHDYYAVISKDEQYAIEIEVYDDDTDVMVTIITDLDIVDELWAGQQN